MPADSRAQRLPVLPLLGTVLFPGNVVTLPGLDGLSQATRRQARAGGLRVLVLTSLAAEGEEPAARLAEVGTEALITDVLRLPNGETGAVVKGLQRRRVVGVTRARGHVTALVASLTDRPGKVPAVQGRALRLAVHKVAELRAAVGGVKEAGPLPDDIDALIFHALSGLPLGRDALLAFLSGTDRATRARRLLAELAKEEELLKLAARIRDKASLDLQEGQRRQLLKEQMRLLQDELGDETLEGDELQQLQDAMAVLPLPIEVREAADRELHRMELMPPGSPDYMVSYSYLAWLKELPWGDKSHPLPPPLSVARRHLNKQHYGLGQVKERILEYLAVMRLKGESHGEILLLSGPPGVGKSSLARQIAAALGRPFVAISLGGVKDEAEIRGHRRTYVGSLPGKLIHAIRQAKSNAPVILLDEIDKVGLDHGRGALSSALLEVLDYEQNHRFVDHYLGLPYDLSNVVFIATANSTAPIPGALLDRMELVELPSYTEQEKRAIAEKHLVPGLRRELGLKDRQLTVPDAALRQIIHLYTREAGVRQLRRELAAVGRKVVKALADGRRPVPITPANLAKYLGPPRFLDEPNDARLVPGVALGLAYTEVGGDILYIETTRIPAPGGKGSLALTGSLGKVMKESAQAALAYLQSLAYARPGLLPIDADVIPASHIHLHLPSGATPKDGPSAGLAIVCAVASLLTERPLPARVAMTGEITLRGQVLPVGGIKEKLLAAHRYGKTRVIIPAANQHDLATLPRDVLRELEIVPVQTMEEALEAAGLTTRAVVPLRRSKTTHRPVSDLRIARYGKSGKSHDLR